MSFELTPISSAPAGSVSYLTVVEADAIASLLPGLAAWAAATGDQKNAALELATADVDAAGPYQGRRYDLTAAQVLEFPRVPYATGGDYRQLGYGQSGAAGYVGNGIAGEVWDWDAATNAAVVPPRVLQAVVWQANHILSGGSGQSMDRQQSIRDGLASQSVGGMSESYTAGAAGGAAAGGRAGLHVRALNLLGKYFLKSGRLL